MDARECVRLGVQLIVAEKFEERAMIVVAAGLREHIDLGALMAELSGVNTYLNFKLLNGINRWLDDIGIEVRIGVIDTIERVVIEHDALPASGYRLSGPVAALTGG